MAESGEGESWPPEQGKKTAVPLPALRNSAAKLENGLRGPQFSTEKKQNEREGDGELTGTERTGGEATEGDEALGKTDDNGGA